MIQMKQEAYRDANQSLSSIRRQAAVMYTNSKQDSSFESMSNNRSYTREK